MIQKAKNAYEQLKAYGIVSRDKACDLFRSGKVEVSIIENHNGHNYIGRFKPSNSTTTGPGKIESTTAFTRMTPGGNAIELRDFIIIGLSTTKEELKEQIEEYEKKISENKEILNVMNDLGLEEYNEADMVTHRIFKELEQKDVTDTTKIKRIKRIISI